MNDIEKAETGFTDEVPPKPRKLPQQGRSRMLFDSIKQSCKQVLEQEGPRRLTATRISEVSGVAMGSIYQYFPNVDAIVATVYEDMAREEIDIARRRLAEEWRSAPLERSLSSVYRGAIRFHQKMLRLDREFHQRFYQSFDLDMWFSETSGDPEAATLVIQELLELHQDEYPCPNPAMQSFIIARACRGVIIDSIKFRPEYLDRPELHSYLMTLAFSILEPGRGQQSGGLPDQRKLGKETVA